MTAAPRIEAVLGRADDMRAEVYARLVAAAAGGRPTLRGRLSGPRCTLATTLPTSLRLEDLGGTPPVAWGILTEPSYWTPELPNLYRLEAEADDSGAIIARVDRLIGLRRLGVRGRSLWLDGRRWVPRGLALPAADFEAAVLRAASMTAVIDDPPESLCAAADAAGVAVVAVVDHAASADHVAERIVGWTQHPAVALAVLPRGRGAEAAVLGPSKGTLLVGLAVDGTAPPQPVPAGIDCLVVQLPAGALPHEAWRDNAPPVPLVACRPGGPAAEISRAGCDRLQADLAAWGVAASAAPLAWDWAGYLQAPLAK
ncbi:MAG: hypothetical protein ACK48S_11355 [Planctomycetia bacterium]